MNLREDVLWCEKYRPKTIKDCILPPKLKGKLQGIVESEKLPNLFMSGSSGVGKTTAAKAICEEMGYDYLFINGSMDGNIDTLRTTIKTFASSLSMEGTRKVVIIDEADYLNPQSTQPALRGFMDEFSKNCGFIFTGNFKNRVIDAVQSRCSNIEFGVSNGDRLPLAKDFLKRVRDILKKENVAFDPDTLSKIVLKHFPDFRKTLNELQSAAKETGEITPDLLVVTSDMNMGALYKALKEKKYNDCRDWAVKNIHNDPPQVFRKIYDSLWSHLEKDSIPQAVVLLAKYQYEAMSGMDFEVTLMAFFTMIMVECEIN